MTPATSITSNYKESRAAASKPAAKVSRRPRPDFSAKLDAGINWFSRNLTGQQKRPADSLNETDWQ